MAITKIIQLSDTHIVDEGALAYGVVDTAFFLEKAVDDIIRRLPKIGPVDAVLVTGDLTDHGTIEAYQRFQKLLTPLNLPVFVVPGNHDRRDALRKTLNDHDYLPATGPLNFHQKIAGLNVLFLDTLDEGYSSGYLGDGTLVWLKTQIETLKNKPILIALHHPPFECGIVHMDKIKLRNDKQLIDILNLHKAPHLMVCGHVHRFIHHQTVWGPMVIAPSPAHAVSLDHTPKGPSMFDMEPGGFLLHKFDHEKQVFTSEYVPIGSFEGPYPFDVEA